MEVDKPPFWDDPEGEIIRWIVFGGDHKDNVGYTREELLRKYLQSIKRRDHSWNRILRSKEGFEKCWKTISDEGMCR